MPALPNYYRLTHVETGEVLEGYARNTARNVPRSRFEPFKNIA